MKYKEIIERFGRAPADLAGFQLLCGGVVKPGDLFVAEGEIVWACFFIGALTDGGGRLPCGARIYRRSDPPRPEGFAPAGNGVHSSKARPEETGAAVVPPSAPLAEQSAADRKGTPIASGFVDYFPDAMAEVARCSLAGNRQHMPGEPLHWDKSKSTDEADALMRHFLDRGTRDTDGQRHSAKVAWRAMALLQREIEAEREAK